MPSAMPIWSRHSGMCVQLACTFQDSQNLYYVMELAKGGELYPPGRILRHASASPTAWSIARV